MTRHTALFVLLSAALLSAACSKKDTAEGAGSITPPSGEVILPGDFYQQQDSRITFTATEPWHIEIEDATRSGEDASWLMVFPSEGMPGEYSLSVVANPNTSGKPRTASVCIRQESHSESHIVRQSAAGYVKAEKQIYSVMPDAGSVEIRTDSNAEFITRISPYGSESCSWIALKGGDGTNVLNFSLTVNDNLEPRIAMIEFMSSSGDRQLGYCLVRQAGIHIVEGHEALEIPDDVFRRYLLENHDTDHDGSISRGEMSAIEVIDCSGMGIASLAGIEYCDNLTYLDCSRNGISSLNVIGCPKLEVLYAENCSIRYMHLECNTELRELNLSSNPLETLIMGVLPRLKRLLLSNTRLTYLNLSGFSALEYLSATSCRITGICLSGCTSLQSAYLLYNSIRHVDLRGLPSLKEYEANFVGNHDMESIYADVAPSFEPTELIVLWYTETGRHCMAKPFVYVRGELISQTMDLANPEII